MSTEEESSYGPSGRRQRSVCERRVNLARPSVPTRSTPLSPLWSTGRSRVHRSTSSTPFCCRSTVPCKTRKSDNRGISNGSATYVSASWSYELCDSSQIASVTSVGGFRYMDEAFASKDRQRMEEGRQFTGGGAILFGFFRVPEASSRETIRRRPSQVMIDRPAPPRPRRTLLGVRHVA